MDKIQELIDLLQQEQKKEEKKTAIHPFQLALTAAASIAATAGVIYAVYRYFTPNYLEDYDDEDFKNDFDDYFEDEDSKEAGEKKSVSQRMNDVKEAAAAKAEEVKGVVADKAEAVKDVVSDTVEKVKDKVAAK